MYCTPDCPHIKDMFKQCHHTKNLGKSFYIEALLIIGHQSNKGTGFASQFIFM